MQLVCLNFSEKSEEPYDWRDFRRTRSTQRTKRSWLMTNLHLFKQLGHWNSKFLIFSTFVNLITGQPYFWEPKVDNYNKWTWRPSWTGVYNLWLSLVPNWTICKFQRSEKMPRIPTTISATESQRAIKTKIVRTERDRSNSAAVSISFHPISKENNNYWAAASFSRKTTLKNALFHEDSFSRCRLEEKVPRRNQITTIVQRRAASLKRSWHQPKRSLEGIEANFKNIKQKC